MRSAGYGRCRAKPQPFLQHFGRIEISQLAQSQLEQKKYHPGLLARIYGAGDYATDRDAVG